MTEFRDLRYVRVEVEDLDAATHFSADVFGLQPADRDGARAMFRSDERNYALCCSSAGDGEAVALTVGSLAALEDVRARLEGEGIAVSDLDKDQAVARQVKAGIAASAPNGVAVEIVWRPMTSGWRYHGPRDAGICSFQSVSMACADIAANERFWTGALGLRIADWAGDAVFLALDDAHHRIALYPSSKDGLLGATWAVEDKNFVMGGWYALKARQAPIVAGPGRQPTSGAMFVTTRAPFGLLMSYVCEMEEGPELAERGPRQFADAAASHCAWGSPTDQAEFLGERT
ncbi:VOC family protein [Roseicyclus sp. F158]|uniref:VOC family protein n=1 Tax=Tropicimonas omnivorans TaxID=3075590 RepID=A0ABU3DLG5_9RHOB|nr:VOC family protein [Roseicyclus sp. F158]MDT0684563.1 VOC family protein [Roseicyclus sp. F158]